MKINPQIIKNTTCIMPLLAIIVSLAYAVFLLEHINIIYGIFHILSLSVLWEITALAILSLIFLFRFFFKKTSLTPVIILVFLLWIIPQLTFISFIEYEYNPVETNYFDLANDKKASGDTNVAKAWNISKKYLDSFSSSQNDIKIPVPIRCLYEDNIVLKMNSFLHIYLFYYQGLEKLTVTDKRGNCSEFARAVAYISNKTLGMQTRIVEISGYNHKIAEVKEDDEWYVLDPLKTTPDSPVLESSYKKIFETYSLKEVNYI